MTEYNRLIYNLDNISSVHRIGYITPRHWANNSIFRLWAVKPNEVLKFSSFWTKWDYVRIDVSNDPEFQPGGKYHRQVSSSGFGFGTQRGNNVIEVIRCYSLDKGETWKFVDFNISPWHESKNKTPEEKKFDELVKKSKKDFLKERTRKQAKVRRERYKKEAEKLGISLEEYKKQQSIKHKKKKEKNKMFKMVDDTERRMEVASVVSELKEEVDKLTEKLTNSNSNLKLTHLKNNKKNIQKAIKVLRTWQGQ